ncbi:MAG: tRNA (guanosine(37)-N1)-methyltransferase TrmD [Calditrichaeota bacterium]|nr:MAG: tRNA (guanosine(37)-N1)-methyltransferase TrmD [Calditrichota bacterium]MBL1207562.1 tRNA (guanosine(37)-N1)-methyltransferase TrmD [Calditrichota bacterium]NOG47394.1 tRNA (guanosine(37)-N1)-methyltransferase TrmD [Calditrichota bacterium]
MRIDIVTGFPAILQSALNQSMIKKGQDKNAVKIHLHDLRDYTDDKHRTIDDYPYGGGAGMVLKVEPFVRCLEDIDKQSKISDSKILLMSPQGRQFVQNTATQLSLHKHLVFLCGHYKGIDQRIHNFFEIEEISIGDYVLSSGEISALVIVDSVVRLLPGVLKDIDSAWTDSFTEELLDAPYFTRPEIFRSAKVPEVLLSGNHTKIEKWRLNQKIKSTKNNRPDLYNKYLKTIK